MPTRREFLKYAAVGVSLGSVGLVGIGSSRCGYAADARPLIDGVGAACRRLALLGWRELLLGATGGELDIAAADLKAELVKPLSRIDRNYPGFGDFAAVGTRAIEPGRPDLSLLYHSFAPPTVVADRAGVELGSFPTLAEIEAVENYVYGAAPPSLAALKERSGGRPLGVVVFALQYRNAPQSVHGRHAELCFSRSGITRLG